MFTKGINDFIKGVSMDEYRLANEIAVLVPWSVKVGF